MVKPIKSGEVGEQVVATAEESCITTDSISVVEGGGGVGAVVSDDLDGECTFQGFQNRSQT